MPACRRPGYQASTRLEVSETDFISQSGHPGDAFQVLFVFWHHGVRYQSGSLRWVGVIFSEFHQAIYPLVLRERRTFPPEMS